MAYTKQGIVYTNQRNVLTWKKAVPTSVIENVSRKYPYTKTGASLPDWRDRIAKKLDATTPYSLDAYKVVKTRTGSYSASGTLYNVPNVQEVTGLMGPIDGNFSHLITDGVAAESIALTSLYKKVNAQISHTNVPKALVEFGDVIRQFGKPAEAILKLTQHHLNRLYLQKRGVGGLKFNSPSYLRAVADTYLEYAFGLAPLINDTRAVAEAFGRFAWETDPDNTRLPPIKLVGRGSHTVSKVTHNTFSALGSNIVINSTTKTSTKARVQYVCGYNSFLTSTPGSKERLNELLGFRPESWVPAVWEAVPWSWLVDYFTNIGEMLDGVEASKVAPTWISKTVSTVTEIEYAENFDPASTLRALTYAYWKNPLASGSGAFQSYRRTTMERTNPPKLGLPPVYFRLPSGLRQMMAMSAVTVQKLRKSQPVISLESSYSNMDRHVYKRELREAVINYRR